MLARSRTALAFTVVFMTGCSAFSLLSPRRADGTPLFGGRNNQPTQNATTPPPTAQNGSDPTQYLNRMDAHLRGQGYAPAGAAIRNNTMPSTGLVAYALDVQPGRCYSAIALGDSGTNLDMVLVDPFGRPEANNVAPDSNPFVNFCPRQAGRYVVRLQMSRGQGGYYYLAYSGPSGRDSNLASFFQSSAGGTNVATTQPPVAPRTAQIDADTQARYAAADASLSRENFTRASDPIGLILEQRQERLFPLNLSASACYAFATFGGAGTSDTDVFVVDGSGAELQSDASAARDALLRFCPPSDGTYQLRTRLYTGSGPVFVAGWVQPRTLVSGTPTNTNTNATQTTTPVMATTSTAASSLTEAYALVNIDMQARGYVIQGDSHDGTLANAASHDFDISVNADKCYAIVALGDSGVRNLDLTLLDAGGRVLDRENETSGRAVVRTCSSEARSVRLVMADGGGTFKFATYEFTHGTRGPSGLVGLTWVRIMEVTSLLQAENYNPSLNFDIETGRLATVGRTVSKTLNLEANHCYAVVVVGGDGVSSVGISLERAGASVAENRTGSSFPDVRICTTQSGRYDLKITSMAGIGSYAYQVFERTGQ